MQYKILEIHNIASIESARIDFSCPPLKDEPVFLICGETGSGKSTILDAICLALYGTAPRFASATTEDIADVMNNDGNGDTADRVIKTNDTKQFLRRGAGEGSVSLVFTDNAGVEYRAEWSVRRARGKADGRFQQVSWTLAFSDTVLSRQSDVRHKVEEITGMNFNQFCRTSMLAQGEFSRFLKSTEAEKADILEKLTRTDIYSRIGAGIFSKMKEKKEAYELQKSLTEGIVIMTEEERVSLVEVLSRKEQELVTLKSETERISGWSGVLESSIALKKKLEECVSREEALAGKYREARAVLAGFDAGTLRRRQELVNLQERLKELDYAVPMFDSVQAIVSDLRLVLSSRAKAEEAGKGYAEALAGGEEARKENEAVAAMLSALSGERLKKQEALDELRKVIVSMDKPAKMSGKAAKDSLHKSLISAGHVLVEMEKDRNSLVGHKAAVNETGARISILSENAAAAESGLAAAVAAFNEENDLYERMKTSVEDWARMTRAKLRVGDDCPVCGRRIEVLQDDSHFEELLAPVMERLAEKRGRKERAETSLNSIKAEIKALEEVLKHESDACAASEKEYARSVSELVAACAECGIAVEAEQFAGECEGAVASLKDRIRKSFESVKGDIAGLDAEIREIESREAAADGMQKDLDTLQKKITGTETAMRQSMEKLSSIGQEAARCAALRESSLKMAEEAMSRASGAIVLPQWQDSFSAGPEDFISGLEGMAEEYFKSKDDLSALSDGILRRDEAASDVREQMMRISEMHPGWEYDSNACSRPDGTEEPADVRTLRKLSSDLLLEVQSLSDSRKNVESELGSVRGEAEDILARVRGMMASETSGVSGFGESPSGSGADVPSSAGNAPAEADCLSFLRVRMDALSESADVLNREIGAGNQRLLHDRENEARAGEEKRKEDALLQEYLKWERFSRLFGDATGSKFKKIAQGFVLQELLSGANTYLSYLSDRYVLDSQPGSLTITVRDLYQGGAVRSVNTLSGGETFLVSLSLALGLSSLDTSVIGVDTLFIDEGFGTLSGDYLNTVMSTLENLHQIGGRKVGIISHVEALRDRIPTQIQVLRSGSSASRVVVVPQVSRS